jgi:'Cold-shock' DNA-binding domain
VHISAVERAGLSSLNEGQQIEFEIEDNRGKSSAVNQGGVGDQLASRQAVAGIRPSSALSCSRTGSRSPSIASRKTERANSSGFTVVLPFDLSVSQASSNAVSNTASVGGSKELLWKLRIVPPSTLYWTMCVIRRKLGANLAKFVTVAGRCHDRTINCF